MQRRGCKCRLCAGTGAVFSSGVDQPARAPHAPLHPQGSAVMSQFIKVFRELAGFYDFLRTQVSVCAYGRAHVPVCARDRVQFQRQPARVMWAGVCRAVHVLSAAPPCPPPPPGGPPPPPPPPPAGRRAGPGPDRARAEGLAGGRAGGDARRAAQVRPARGRVRRDTVRGEVWGAGRGCGSPGPRIRHAVVRLGPGSRCWGLCGSRGRLLGPAARCGGWCHGAAPQAAGATCIRSPAQQPRAAGLPRARRTRSQAPGARLFYPPTHPTTLIFSV